MIGREMFVVGIQVDLWFAPLKGELLYMALLLEGYLVRLKLVSGMESTLISSILKRRLKTKLLEEMIILVLSTELDSRMDNVIVD